MVTTMQIIATQDGRRRIDMKYTIITIGVLFLAVGANIGHEITIGMGAAFIAWGLLRGSVK